MPRVTYVKHAQQRYAMVPDIDPATGLQKTITTSRTTREKPGRPSRQVIRQLTKPDPDRPLDPETCGRCGEKILPGMPYKHITPRSGPYSGRRMVRCAGCPSWFPWEYSNSLNAQLAQVSHEFGLAIDSAESEDDVTSALEEAASSVREIAEAKREAAQNIEEGFGHETEQSGELNQTADDLDSWADEIGNVSVPDFPDPEDEECEDCAGTGKLVKLPGDSDPEPWRPGSYAEGAVQECGECDGSGHPDEVTSDQLDEWRDEVRSETAIVEEAPV